ncbi:MULTISPECIES: DMT family transporter [Burkholderia]|uniref:Multidrug DMT transporter permease n=1 Tax=Burkholderia cenocepacia TaxID=95486 RepID=A0A071MBS5_9BURK|nr:MULTISPECIES: DMT family transporter [Burkholderia]AOJ25178.1 multidrug DMT transporter permease [Burkholderia seminalis]KVF43146.1 multidrug DMT transporter permease [Burkholderia seminalis]MBJ9593501.1 DMT family transporter [Burkholderia seminalis]MBN3741687.1 DMT family transporter [Burkholderia sp. Tr-20355]MCA8038886.1 DMT family transporter [Burkholderia seminalis]
MNNAVRGSLPTLAILIGASVWGLIWYPLRILASLGVTGTLASALTSLVAFLFVVVARRRTIATLRWHWVLPGIALTAGVTNLGFVWGTIHGEVLRVMLLFYLTPAWTAVYAHFLLRERLTWAGAGLAALSIGGAMLMLWSPKLGLPLPANPAEWAGLAAGLSFAMSNVLVIKASRELPEMRAEMRTATLFGGAAVFGAIASLFEGLPAAPAGGQLGVAALIIAAIGVTMASNNLLVQYGLARVPANRASIIMLFEIVITALSAWVFASELPTAREWAGGACIVLATLLSSRVHRAAPASGKPGDGRDGARAMV